uniref:Uncharacterized protein n=2 Tax=Cacopsylla melanoneura TaxID=428564 RepID=A0A8D9BFX9_9HEMI
MWPCGIVYFPIRDRLTMWHSVPYCPIHGKAVYFSFKYTPSQHFLSRPNCFFFFFWYLRCIMFLFSLRSFYSRKRAYQLSHNFGNNVPCSNVGACLTVDHSGRSYVRKRNHGLHGNA